MINISKILQQEPTLTPFGIEGAGTFKTNGKFEQEDQKQIETCIDWLSTRPVQKTMNRKVTSYSIKHIIERETGTYVANGCFIAAVIHLGIPYERIYDTPNIHVAIGMKQLYRYQK